MEENYKKDGQKKTIYVSNATYGSMHKSAWTYIHFIKDKTKYNHWKNTQDVIKWFGDILNKKIIYIHCIRGDFYPSITEELLDKALDVASHYKEITTNERRIIKHTKKTTLYNNNMPWCKIRSDFNVTMCSFNGEETWELVGLFLLSQLTHLNVNIGLNRNDGPATCTKSPKQVEAIEKEMCKIFKHNSLQITIEATNKKL